MKSFHCHISLQTKFTLSLSHFTANTSRIWTWTENFRLSLLRPHSFFRTKQENSETSAQNSIYKYKGNFHNISFRYNRFGDYRTLLLFTPSPLHRSFPESLHETMVELSVPFTLQIVIWQFNTVLCIKVIITNVCVSTHAFLIITLIRETILNCQAIICSVKESSNFFTSWRVIYTFSFSVSISSTIFFLSFILFGLDIESRHLKL